MPRCSRHNVKEGWREEPCRCVKGAYRGCGCPFAGATTTGYLLSPLRGEEGGAPMVLSNVGASVPGLTTRARHDRPAGARGGEVIEWRDMPPIRAAFVH